MVIVFSKSRGISDIIFYFCMFWSYDAKTWHQKNTKHNLLYQIDECIIIQECIDANKAPIQVQKETNTFKIWKTLNQQWPLLQRVQTYSIFFFFLVCPWPNPPFKEKYGYAHTQILSR